MTVQLDPATGWPCFPNPSVVGDSLAVDEVGRIPVGEVDAVMAANAPGPGGPRSRRSSRSPPTRTCARTPSRRTRS